MKQLSIFFLFLSICILLSCAKEYDETTFIPGKIVEPEIIINSGITGHVLYNNRRFLNDATIQVGNESTTSNQYGQFSFENIPMDAEGQLIKITKEGYFDQYKLIYPEVGKDPYITTILLNKSQQGSFQSNAGGTILGDRLNINFKPNSIIDNQNQPYTGEIIVYQAPINPDDKNFDFIAPGNLRSVDENGDNTILQSFAMSVIQLESPDGLPLNLKEGSSAQLTFEIPTTHLGEAPESIPLWYFDENTGYWVEEGLANKIGSEYIGDVSHFSFWNCDISGTAFKLSFHLVKPNGDPLSNSIVRLTSSSGLINGAEYTDSDGYASGLVPGFTPLSLIVYGINENCDPSQPIPIGSITADIDLGDIVVDGDPYLTTIKAKIVDCNGLPIPNAKFSTFISWNMNLSEQIERISDSNGNIYLAVNQCSNYTGSQYQITNQATGISSSVRKFTVALGELEVDLGELVHCVDETPYIFMGSSNPDNALYYSNNVTATIIDYGSNNSKAILIQTEEGSKSISVYLDFRYYQNRFITPIEDVNFEGSGIFFWNGFLGSSGVFQSFSLGIRGIVGEEIKGWVDLEHPNDPEIKEYLEFSVIISE